MHSTLAETNRNGMMAFPNLRRWRTVSFLLLLAVLAYGGPGLEARFVEITEAEGEASVSQEATYTRRELSSSKRLREGHASKIEEDKTKCQSASRLSRLRSVDEEAPVCECFDLPPPPRAPPALV